MNLSNPFETIVCHVGTCVFYTVKVKEVFTLEVDDFVWLPMGAPCLLIDTNGIVLSEDVKKNLGILPDSPLGLYFTKTFSYSPLTMKKLEYLRKELDCIGTDLRLAKIGDFVLHSSLGGFKKVTNISKESPPKLYEDFDIIAYVSQQNSSYTVFRSKEKEV